MISREQALELLNKNIENKNILKHMLATEACMKALAKKLGADNEDEWAMAGLLHDLDYEKFKDGNYTDHGQKSVEMIEEAGLDVPQSVKQAIKAHCFNLHPEWSPQNLMEWSIFICDSLTGLIVATTLVLPSKKLAEVTAERIMNRFKEKAFARGTRREDVRMCEEKLSLKLEEFIDICLKAMQGISDDLGL